MTTRNYDDWKLMTPEEDYEARNFSATDPITDEDRITYWKGAYERMASRNHRLHKILDIANAALRKIRDDFQPSNVGEQELVLSEFRKCAATAIKDQNFGGADV